MTAKIVEAVVKEKTGSGKKAAPAQQVIEATPHEADDIAQAAKLDCGPWENQLGEIIRLIEGLPPIYQLYASYAANKTVDAAAVREWSNHPASNIESVEHYRGAAIKCSVADERAAMTTFIVDSGIAMLYQALIHGKIDTNPAVLIACLPKDHQGPAMERLEIQMEEALCEAESGISSGEPQTDTEHDDIDENEFNEIVAPDKVDNSRETVACITCEKYRPRASRCDAGYTHTISFQKKKVPGKIKPYQQRQCDGYRPKHNIYTARFKNDDTAVSI